MWKVEWEDAARKELRRLGAAEQERILRYLHDRIISSENPRRFGKALVGNKSGLWRYRIGDYRLVCRIEDLQLVVLIVKVGHRKDVYE